MNTEIQRIIASIKEVSDGDPWYGKSIQTLLNEIDPSIVNKKFNNSSHSMIDLIYHMVTWTEFTKDRIEKIKNLEVKLFEVLNWRQTNAEINTWNNGIARLTSATNKIIELLHASTDELLEQKVYYRDYNFRYLLNGWIQHNIYHLGQIAYIKSLHT